MAFTAERSPLFPPIEPYRAGTLAVDEIHTIYFEECGNPEGKPVVFLHGGPGGGAQPEYRRYFDPKIWRVVLFDQRGCGRSTPHAELRNNTTWHLVADIETLRLHLGIDRWAVMGGSWGSTLALAYAETHPERCTEIILRSIFMLRQQEIQWFYQEGASFIFPDFWEDYLAPIPVEERDDLVRAYYRRLTGGDTVARQEAAIAWSTWEGRTSKLFPSKGLASKMADPEFAAAFARIECHYFINGGFMESDSWLLDNVSRIQSIPGAIVQGRYDVVCPMMTAWELHRAWPEAEFCLIDDAGHSMSEPGITAKLMDIIKGFGDRYG
ncbi:MAG: prolyl aminopeptidase [Cyanobacteria bacterium P01_C01_bin.89]